MAESNTDEFDYIPDGWKEDIHGEHHVEWHYNVDTTIFVRLKPDDREGEYIVETVTGTNNKGEQFVPSTLDQLNREEAFEIAHAMIYTANGAFTNVPQEMNNHQ